MDPKALLWDSVWKTLAGGRDGLYAPSSVLLLKILQLFDGEVKGRRVLEVGCGTASDSIALARLGAECYVLDFSSRAMQICGFLMQQKDAILHRCLGECRSLPFYKSSFDLVFSAGLVEHFKEPSLVIKEQVRVIKPGGYLLVDVPQRFNWYALSKRIRMFMKTHPFGWETDFTLHALKRLGKTANLEPMVLYGRGADLPPQLPKIMRHCWHRFISAKIERSFIGPWICVNIGAIFKKTNKLLKKPKEQL